MNPYQPPKSAPPAKFRPPRPPWFDRVCAIRTHIALGSILAIFGGFGLSAFHQHSGMLVSQLGGILFATAILATVPLTIIGLVIGFLEGRRRSRRKGAAEES